MQIKALSILTVFVWVLFSQLAIGQTSQSAIDVLKQMLAEEFEVHHRLNVPDSRVRLAMPDAKTEGYKSPAPELKNGVIFFDTFPLEIAQSWNIDVERLSCNLRSEECTISVNFSVIAATTERRNEGPVRLNKCREIIPLKNPESRISVYRFKWLDGAWRLLNLPLPRVNAASLRILMEEEQSQRLQRPPEMYSLQAQRESVQYDLDCQRRQIDMLISLSVASPAQQRPVQ
jgi:hypothetical protein